MESTKTFIDTQATAMVTVSTKTLRNRRRRQAYRKRRQEKRRVLREKKELLLPLIKKLIEQIKDQEDGFTAVQHKKKSAPKYTEEYFRYGFYRFDDYFSPADFYAGKTIIQDGEHWYMYNYAGKRWCISQKLRNKQIHALNGNGSCFSVSVHIDNAPRFDGWNINDTSRVKKSSSCFKSQSEMDLEEAVFYSQASMPRSSDRKKANKKAHADNGNGSSENIREQQEEIGRDIEQTVISTERSSQIDVQAVKLPEERIPGDGSYLNNNTESLIYRRHQLQKFQITAATVVETKIVDFDPFLAYYNSTLTKNSSMATVRDIHFDLKIEVVIQSLPSVGGILHFAFDRFSGGLNDKYKMFALPTTMVDLSAKDSTEIMIKMDLPFRVMNTLSTPYAATGNGNLFCYLATNFYLPQAISSPVTVTIFGTPINVKPYNLRPRSNLVLQSALVPLDRAAEQNITERYPAVHSMKPAEIACHWGFVSRTSIPSALAIGDEITNVDMHPTEHETPLCHVASHYSYYRGSMKLKLTMNLSKFQNITIAAIYVPADVAFDNAKYEAYAFTEIMFDEKHEAVLTVNYSSGSNWLPIFVGDDINERAAYGKVYFVLRSPLVSTTPYANDPQLLVQICGGEDFEVAHPRDASKVWQQPAILESDQTLNPEVPRRMLMPTTNLYQDARLPVYYTRITLSEKPHMIPVTCTRGNAGVLGLLKNTHAAWSGALNYYFIFEKDGQAEVRYDPTKRFAGNTKVSQAAEMAGAGYCKFMNSRTNPHNHISVPFCSLYDYLPTRGGGMMSRLTNGNCNGALMIAGTGTVRVYRAAGDDFRVHMYNSFDDLSQDADEIVVQDKINIEDLIENPKAPTVAYLQFGDDIQLVPTQETLEGRGDDEEIELDIWVHDIKGRWAGFVQEEYDITKPDWLLAEERYEIACEVLDNAAHDSDAYDRAVEDYWRPIESDDEAETYSEGWPEPDEGDLGEPDERVMLFRALNNDEIADEYIFRIEEGDVIFNDAIVLEIFDEFSDGDRAERWDYDLNVGPYRFVYFSGDVHIQGLEPRQTVNIHGINFRTTSRGVCPLTRNAVQSLSNIYNMRQPRRGDNINANRVAHSTNGNGKNIFGFNGETVDAAAAEHVTTMQMVQGLVPDIRAMLMKIDGATTMAQETTNTICDMLSSDTNFVGALLKVVSGGIQAIKSLILVLHRSVLAILKAVTPEFILRFVKGPIIEGLTDTEICMIYATVIVSAAMALGIKDTFAIIAAIAVVGCAVPNIQKHMGNLTENLFDTFFASAVQKSDAEIEAPSGVACGVSLLVAIITFFIPNNNFNLKATSNFSKDVAGLFSGAKALDEMMNGILPLVLAIPGVSTVLGGAYKDVEILATVDVAAYVDEVKDIMTTDFYNEPLTNEKVRTQERLWMIHKQLDRLLPKVSNKTNFFFNQALKKVMDEQQKMYRHTRAFKGAGRERFPPFVIMISGSTRVGKSYMTSHIQRMFCEMMGWDPEIDIYTRQPTDPYFTGLANQKIFYVDDLHTNITSDGADSDMAMIMSFATNSPWAPRMAAIEDKGRNVNALLGIFCTNTPGVPAYPGIRNVEAYLARRHLLIGMERIAPGYSADYSHARFFLIDPLCEQGRTRLDENFVRCADQNARYYNFQELWSLMSRKFLDHMVRERIAREDRRNAGVNLPMPDDNIVRIARMLADHCDDVDFVPITDIEKAQRLAKMEVLTEIETLNMGGSIQKYKQVIDRFPDDIVRTAATDIFYIPSEDTFIWKALYQKDDPVRSDMHAALYFELMQCCQDEIWDAEETLSYYCEIQQKIRNYIKVVSECEDSDEEDEFLSCIEEEYVDTVKRGAIRKRELFKKAAELGTVGKRSFKEVLEGMYAKIPRWLSILVASLCVGGAIYYTLRKLTGVSSIEEKMVASMKEKIERVTAKIVPGVEYHKELAPALAMPTKPREIQKVVPPTEYHKELAPALAMPTKPREIAKVMPPTEYHKELAPAVTLKTKAPTTEQERENLIATYTENPRSTSLTTTNLQVESAEQIQTSIDLYRHGRVGRIRRPGVSLNFYWLDDHTIYMNRHFWTVLGGVQQHEEVELYWQDAQKGLRCLAFGFNKDQVRCMPHTDHALYILEAPVQGIRSGWKLLATEEELVNTYPTMAVLISSTTGAEFEHQRCAVVKRRVRGETLNTYINLDGTQGEINHTAIYLEGFAYSASTEGGYCGSLLVFPHKGGRIFGTHSASIRHGEDQGWGLSQFIHRELVQEMLTSSEPLFPGSEGGLRIPAPIFDARENALTVMLNLEVGYTPMIDVTPYGLPVVKITGYGEATRGAMMTAYKKSFVSDFFPNEPYRVPAVLHPGDKRTPYSYDPRPDILGKYNKVIKPIPARILSQVVEHLTEQYRQLTHPYKPSSILSFHESVNGVPEAPFFDAINFHTSAGIPWAQQGYQRKGAFFVETGSYPNGQPIRECVVPELLARFDHIIEEAKQGRMVEDVVFQEFMKDELLKRAKIYEKPATRGIANPPLDLLLAERAAFLPFIALTQYNRHKIDCQVGINPMSGIEWTEMIQRLKANSDLVFDADYSAFDSTIHGNTLDAWCDIVNGVMGGTEEVRRARRTLVRYSYDRISQVTNVQVKISQGMASGMPFTAVGNSGCNSIYLRAAWLMLAEEHAPEMADLALFDKHVKAIVYGDDNVVTVKAQVKNWYNLRNIALCLEPFGILMTDGAKNPRHMTQPFNVWENIRFLKRAFKKDEKTGLYLAPIDKKTIIDRVRYVKSKDAWWPDLEMRIESSMADCMMHGEEYFEAFKFFINSVMEERGFPNFTMSFRTERGKWEAAAQLFKLESGNEMTFARQNNQAVIEVFHVRLDRAPTVINGQYYLRVNGPRDPAGNEANTLERWVLPANITNPSQITPPTVPPTSTGNVSAQEIQRAVNNAFAQQRPVLTQVEIQQAVARELALRPMCPNANQIQVLLDNALARLPQTGVTQADLQALINNAYLTYVVPTLPTPPTAFVPNIRKRSDRGERFPFYNHSVVHDNLHKNGDMRAALEFVTSKGYRTVTILGRTFIEGADWPNWASGPVTYNGAMILDMLEQQGVVVEVNHGKWRNSEMNQNLVKIARFLSTCFIYQTDKDWANRY